MLLGASNSKDRRSAKSALTRRILEEFSSDTTVTPDELKGFRPIFAALEKLLSS